jgi:hypothetical protein
MYTKSSNWSLPMISMLVLWGATAFRPVGRYQRFGRAYFLHLQGRSGGSMYLQVNALRPRKPAPISSPPWEPQISSHDDLQPDFCMQFLFPHMTATLSTSNIRLDFIAIIILREDYKFIFSDTISNLGNGMTWVQVREIRTGRSYCTCVSTVEPEPRRQLWYPTHLEQENTAT